MNTNDQEFITHTIKDRNFLFFKQGITKNKKIIKRLKYGWGFDAKSA